MRIVHVVRQFHPAMGGLESVVLELASVQAAAGHAVRVVTLNRLFNSAGAARLPAHDTLAGTEIVRIPFWGSQRYPIAPSVLNHIRDADVVHVHAIDFFFDFLAWCKLIHRRVLVVSTHGGYFHTSFARRLKQIYFAVVTRLSLRRYAAVVAVSAADQKLFDTIRRRGVVCIENGINTEKYAGAGARVPTKTMIALGRFSTNKRLDQLVAFLAALRRRDPEWRLKIVGRSWDITPEDLRALAARSGVGDAVEVFESLPDAAVRALMGDCAVLVSTSEYEGFGLAAVEGMSAGLWPLLSDIPPFRHLVDRARIGMTVDFAAPASAAGQFLGEWARIAVNFSAYRELSILAAGRYSWGNVTQLYQSVYESALGTRTRAILGVPIHACSFPTAVEMLDGRFERGESTIVVFANAHTMTVASMNTALWAILQRAIVFNDGVGMDFASRILFGRRFPENLNGTDFVPRYLQVTKHAYRVYLLGAQPGVAERAAARFQELSPRHVIVGCHHGYIAAAEGPQLLATIRASTADILLVAMGNPHQELWLMDHLEKTGCRLGFGVGALFDFMAGDIRRAPRWMRSAQMEWIYRIIQEPARLSRRYFIGGAAFIGKILSQWWSGIRVSDGAERL